MSEVYKLVWSRALNTRQVELIPLVYNGVMYIPHPGGVTEAVDATTGDLVWGSTAANPRKAVAVPQVLVTSQSMTTRFFSRQAKGFSLPLMPELEWWSGKR